MDAVGIMPILFSFLYTGEKNKEYKMRSFVKYLNEFENEKSILMA